MPKGYFDRVPTIRTEKQMFARLAQRTGKLDPSGSGDDSSKIVPPGTSPPAPTPALDWEAPVKGTEAIVTRCRRYSVSRARVGGEYLYTAWTRLPTPNPIGEAQKSAQAAQELCLQHWRAIQ